jgi:large subunit ribosomal protein L18
MLAIRRKKRTSAIKRIRAKFGRHVEHEILVFCSGRNIYAQIINLKSGVTEFSICTCDKNDTKNHRNIKTAAELGKKLSVECKKRKINNVSFNRAEKIFHGVVKAVADGFYKK